MTLVIDTRKVNCCRYVVVRKANFQRFQYGGTQLLINNEHKVLVEEREEEPLPMDCLGRGAKEKTNIARGAWQGGVEADAEHRSGPRTGDAGD